MSSTSKEPPIDFEQLIESLSEVERCCEAQLGPEAHEWFFAMREMLYDFKRVLETCRGLSAAESPARVREQVRELVATVLYGVLPHVEGHLKAIEPGLQEEP